MRLKVFSPTGVVLDELVRKVDAEALDGYWTLLPKHVDFVTALKAGIVTYQLESGTKAYVACNEGILVKKKDQVCISTKLAVLDTDLEKLTKTIEQDFKQMQQERKEVSATLARLEIGLTKGLMRLNKEGGADV